jgi:hypothetical protein
LSAKQVDEIIELLDKEEELVLEHQIDMKLEKFEVEKETPIESMPNKSQPQAKKEQIPIIPKQPQDTRPKV